MVTQQLHFSFTRDRPSSTKGEACGEERSVRQVATASGGSGPIGPALMEEVVRRENLVRALKRVRANRGSPGVDGMTVDELPGYLKENWPRIREELLSGQYRPQPIKQVLILITAG